MLGKKRVKIVVQSRIDHGTFDGVFTYGPGLHEVDEDLAHEWLERQLAVRYVEGSEAKPGLLNPPLPTLPDDLHF